MMKKANWRWQLLSPIFALLLWLADQSIGLYDRVEFAAQDALLRMDTQWHQPPVDVVLVDIDQKSLDVMNSVAGSYPWPRSVLAEAVEGLESWHASAIVFDLFFNEADTFRADSDALFRDTVDRHDNIYVPTLLLSEGHGAPLNRLQQLAPGLRLQGDSSRAFAPLLLPLVLNPHSWRGGIANVQLDSDGVERRFDLYVQRSGWRLPELAWRVGQDLQWPQPSSPQMMVHWYGQGWQRYSFSDLYLNLDQHLNKKQDIPDAEIPHPDFTGKIVVLGISAPGLSSEHRTPISLHHQTLTTLATVLANLRHGDWLGICVVRSWLGAFLLMGLLWGFWQEWSLWYLIVALLVLTLSLSAGSWALVHFHHLLLVGLAGVAMAWTLMFWQIFLVYLRNRWQYQQAEMQLMRFLDPGQVSQVLKNPDIQSSLSPQFRSVTVLYAQVRGLQYWSDAQTPEEVQKRLNQCLLRQTGILFSAKATLNGWSGGELRAVWNAPLDDVNQVRHALDAALAMSEMVDSLAGELRVAPEAMDLRIAVHSGLALSGFLGTGERMDYTVIGPVADQVAQLLYQTSKQSPILVSSPIQQMGFAPYVFRECGALIGTGMVFELLRHHSH